MATIIWQELGSPKNVIPQIDVVNYSSSASTSEVCRWTLPKYTRKIIINNAYGVNCESATLYVKSKAPNTATTHVLMELPKGTTTNTVERDLASDAYGYDVFLCMSGMSSKVRIESMEFIV